ncbi:BRO-N domain-containing protein [Moraxella sp. ZY200743]|uniref:BRO-N domain-containing protein n=1 Tax=Moraxella sp. ZY200743 TaxID=2911970 RepID=UPI003D7C916D
MSNLINLTFETSNPIRIIDQNGEFWFVANDVCNILEIANARDALSRLDDDEKADVALTDTSSNGVKQSRKFNIINESGLYALILRSRKAMEKGTVQHKFRKWVTSEVLPSIRKTGTYTTPTVQSNTLSDKDWTNLKRLVWLCERNFKMQGSAGYAIWSRLRAVTGVKSPAKFSREHLPIIATELERIIKICEQYNDVRRTTEKLIIKNVLKYGDDEPMDFFLAEMVEKATDYNQAKAECLSAFFGKELLALLT